LTRAPRRHHPASLGWGLLAGILAAHSAVGLAAGPYDPEVAYRTVTTPHFYIMYPEGYRPLAYRTAQLAEANFHFLQKRYASAPEGRTSIVINDQTDQANGSATLLPNKVITLFVTAPTRVSGLEEYDDWLSTLLVHEMAHIFQLDMHWGLPTVGRYILGNYVAMNAYAAAWSTEGFAVYEETVASGSGRGRSTYVDMVLRIAALENRFPAIDQAYRGYANWPFGNVAYFFGGRFQLWLARKYGEQGLLEYHRTYATDPLPYLTYIPALMEFDDTLESLWDDFEQDELLRAQTQLRRIETSTLPVTQPVRLTFHGGESVGPRITPDGQHIVFSTRSPKDGPRVRRMRIDGTEEEVLLNDTLSQAVGFQPDGRAFFFQQTEINQRFYTHDDLYRYDFGRETYDRLTVAPDLQSQFLAPSGALRAREPDVAPDGKTLVFVQSPEGQNRLLLATLDADRLTLRPRILVPVEPGVAFSGPRFSPDGSLVAVARFRLGQRDIVIYDLEGRLVREITRDRHQDTDPTWSPDGRWLVFSSDRTRIYNLYAHDMITGETRQLTNVTSGAFQPTIAPDQKTAIFRGYSADGFDVYRTDFSPESRPLSRLALEPLELVDTRIRALPFQNPDAPGIPPQPTDTSTITGSTTWSEDAYNPFETLLPSLDSWNLLPAIAANEREVFLSLSHFGYDARQTHSYSLQVNYGTFTQFLGGNVMYNYDGLEPTFTVSGSASAVTFGSSLFIEQDPQQSCTLGGTVDTGDGRRFCFGSRDGLYNQQRSYGQVGISLPIRQRHQLSIAYRFEHRTNLDPLPEGTVTSALPPSGNFARIQMGYSYANVRSFPHSVSLERGPAFAIALSGLSGGLGGDFNQVLVTTEGRYYWDIPWQPKWLKNHVLALRLGLGLGGGPDLGEQFRLGGVAGFSALTTTTENFYALRGLDTAVLRGEGVLSGTIEYRAPIFRVDRGLFTLPFSLQVIHVALYTDFGRVFDEISQTIFETDFLGPFAVSAGGELNVDILLGFSLPLRLRFGAAYVIKVPENLSREQSASNNLYFQIGSFF
jgi:Tol biopolymer transport system component